jgi:hypothetical protein
MVEINIHDRISSNFTTLDVFVSTACHIARGGTLEVMNYGKLALHYHFIPIFAEGRPPSMARLFILILRIASKH